MHQFKLGPKKESQWKPKILLVTSQQLVILRSSKELRLERTIRYSCLVDIFFSPMYQLVKLQLRSGEIIYYNTARESIPEELVDVVTENIKRYREKIESGISRDSFIAQVEQTNQHLSASASFFNEQEPVRL